MFKVKKWRYVNDVKWCRPSTFIVNSEHPSHLFEIFSIGDFEQAINCHDIINCYYYLPLYILILSLAVAVYRFIP